MQTTNVKKHHEPLFQISKRESIPLLKSIGIRVIAIAASLIVCALVTVFITGYNPLQLFTALFEGSFGDSNKVWYMLQNLAMMLCVSLAVTPAFKMKFWNIGAEGQVLVGCVVTAACMIYFGNTVPDYLLLPLMLIVSVLAGVIWAIIPAFFKAYWNTNETLFTLMMNYVAIQLVSFCIVYWENPKDSNSVGIINLFTKGGWMPTVFGQKYLLNIIIVALLTVALYVYLKCSKQGYEISVVGESVKTANYIGINVKKVILRTMAISGALCGVAGFLLVSGTHHSISTETAGGMGFTAIMVSWLAKFNPIMMVLTSFLIVFLDLGASEIATLCKINESFADILTGIILFFIIGCEFFVNYKISIRNKHKEAK